MRDLGIVKTKTEDTLSPNQIETNIDELKRKLKKNTSSLYQHLYSGVNNTFIEELNWKNPLASQVISDNSSLVQQLPNQLQHTFMKPARQMIPTLPLIIQSKCNDFISSFTGNHMIDTSRKFLHNNTWKETDDQLAIVTEQIFNTL